MLRTFLLSSFILGTTHGQIVINEFSASTAERNLRWDANDQPFAGSGPAWWAPTFDDTDWIDGSAPIGYSLGSLSTNLFSTLRNVSPSFYTRTTFDVSAGEASSSSPLRLNINYNDGFIAWINGIEVARSNMGAPKSHIYHDQLSYVESTLSTNTQTFNLPIASSLLVEGDNVIAIQINNNTIDGNMRLDLELEINNPSGNDPHLVNFGSPLKYRPGLTEPSSDLVEPAALAEGPSDWIELHNPTASPVNLTGWTLSDAPNLISKWTFPSGTTIGAGGYLVILADDPDAPIPGATYLHSNFKLGSTGDDIGLYDASGTTIDELASEYPNQYPNYSYGRDPSGQFAFHATPSPGKPNTGLTFSGKADAPDFDNKGGFYDNPVSVTLTSQTPDVLIRYTTDGTVPTMTNGLTYFSPLSLAQVTNRKGHVIRARSFKDGFIASNIKTNTYLIGQDARLRTSPSLIYAGDPQRSLYDPFGVMAIGGGTYSNNQWQSSQPTDYNNVINRGQAYERPIHAEFYFADGTVGFRSDVGLRVAASSYSRPRMTLNQTASSPWPDNPTEKPSFNLYFRDDYGNPSVNLPLNGPARTFSKYERFRIRAGKNDIRNPFVIDELIRRLSHDMGNGASLGVINSLYVNGDLKGFYNMVERLREPFFQSLHSTDPNAQWDVLQFEGEDNVAEGDYVAWDDMISRLNASTTTANWERVLEVADVANMADYYLLNIYGATWDWPHNNWVAAKERSPEGRYRLYVWDAEGAMGLYNNRLASQEMINTYILGTSNGLGGQNGTEGELRDLWRGLNRWEEFRILFADRIHKHMFNDGILDDRDGDNSQVKARFDGLVDEFSDLLSIMNGQSVQTSRVTAWLNPNNGRRTYLLGPNREEFRDNDLWPETAPPVFSKFGGSVPQGGSLVITNEAGDYFYTTDGSDPRLPGGTANPNATQQAGSLIDVNLLPLGSVWKHNAVDGDLGTSWKNAAYDDSLWLSGPAPLGYGNVRDSVTGETFPISTTVNQPFPRQPTSYFRTTFDLSSAASVAELTLQIRVDGGAVIYLNGVEALRESNVPANADYNTPPDSDASDGNEGDLDIYTLDPALLMEGTNLIAVELHNGPTSSDMFIDIQLLSKKANDSNLPIPINGPTTVKARSFNNGEWSALTEASFTVDTVPADASNLAIVEMLYNPAGPSMSEEQAGFNDGDMFEFLRIQNTGTQNIDLTNVRFTAGINFDFSTTATKVLPPGGIAIIVANLDAFRFRYGTGFDALIAGQYGNRLSNGGEQLRLIGQSDAIIHEFTYGTTSPWPVLTALDGHSIINSNPVGSHGTAGNWQPSINLGGTPDGKLNFIKWQVSLFTPAQLGNPAISGPNGDPDQDGWSNFMEFALGSLPNDPQSYPAEITAGVTTIGEDRHLTLTFTRASYSGGVDFSAQLGADLQNWTNGGLVHGTETRNPDGSITARFRHPAPISAGKQFMRLKAAE
ncbi:MAG: lamin tail domain-containing protein [Verrucomicrobiaceae bacterium]